MTRDQALEILHKNMQSANLRRHCYAVGVVMKSLAKRLGESENADKWEIAGILHDADWEKTGATPEEHTKHTVAWIKEVEPDEELENAKNTYEKNIQTRKDRHPLEYPNCGSVFKNLRDPEQIKKVLSAKSSIPK